MAALNGQSIKELCGSPNDGKLFDKVEPKQFVELGQEKKSLGRGQVRSISYFSLLDATST